MTERPLVERLESLKQDIDHSWGSLKPKAVAIDADIDAAIAEIGRLGAENAAKDAEMQALKKEYDEEVISHDIEEKGFKEKNREIALECERLRKERLWVTNKLGLDPAVTISGIQGRLHVACHNEGLTKELISQQKGWTEKIAALESQLQAAQSENDGLTKQKAAFFEEFEKYRSQLADQKHVNHLMGDRLAEVDSLHPDYGRILAERTAEVQEARRHLSKINNSCGVLSQENSDLKSELEKVKRKLTIARNCHDAALAIYEKEKQQNARLASQLRVAREALKHIGQLASQRLPSGEITYRSSGELVSLIESAAKAALVALAPQSAVEE